MQCATARQDNAVARLHVCPVNYTTIHYAHTMVHMYARALGPCMPSVTRGIRPYAPCEQLTIVVQGEEWQQPVEIPIYRGDHNSLCDNF